MESRVLAAVDRHNKGYNCAQAIACTYCDLFGVDEQTAYKMTEAFGFGMGTQSVCGALSGALVLAGLDGSGGVEAPGKTKGATYKVARGLTAQFKDAAGALLCSELKGGSSKVSCEDCIKYAAQMVEESLLKDL